MRYDKLYTGRDKVCVEVCERLGNQMFQLFAAICNMREGQTLVIRGDLNPQVASVLASSGIPYGKEGTVYRGYPVTYRGFSQDYGFLDEDLLHSRIVLPESAPLDTVIHVRRDDYVGNGEYNTLTSDYIHRVMGKYGVSGGVTVISTPDGIEWAREIGLPSDTRYVSSDPLSDLAAIASAKTVICSGSSFSVMGGILNRTPGKRCIIPVPYDNLRAGSEGVIPPYFYVEPLDTERTVDVFCFATGSYKVYFRDFIDTLGFFLPSYRKRLVLFTDGLEEFRGIRNYRGIEIDYHEYSKLGIECIMDRPRIIYEYMMKSDSAYSALLNVNAVFKPNPDESFLSDSKVTCTYHFYDCLDNLNNGFSPRMTYNGRPYSQASTVLAPKDVSLEMYRYVADTLAERIAENRIPEWHDETIMNNWMCIHPERVKMFNSSKYLTLLEKPKEVRENTLETR